MEVGRRRFDKRGWRQKAVGWRLEARGRSSEVGGECWRLGVGGQSSGAGGGRSDAGCWRLARGWRPEAGGRGLEVGGWRLGAGDFVTIGFVTILSQFVTISSRTFVLVTIVSRLALLQLYYEYLCLFLPGDRCYNFVPIILVSIVS